MRRWLLLGGLVALSAIAAVVIWPVDREPFQIDDELFWVEEAELWVNQSDGSNRYIFTIEHDSGHFAEPENADVTFFGRIYCHLKVHDRTRMDFEQADKVSISVRNYFWKIGRFGTWKDQGRTFDVSKAQCISENGA